MPTRCFPRGSRWLWLAAVLLACQRGDSDLSQWRDLPERGAELLSARDTVHVRAEGSEAPASLRNALDSIAHLEVVDSIGTLESDTPGEMFGRIQAAAALPSGRIAVLDSRYQELRLYAAHPLPLRLIGAAGRPGRGPGEFRNPDALAQTATTVFVADGYNLTRFQVQQDGFAFVATTGMQASAEDLCILDDALYVHGLRYTEGTSETIHRFTLDGHYRSSFAPVYESSNPMAMVYMAEGQIACATTARLIVHVASYRPYISAFNSAGELVWLSRIDGYSEVEIREGPNRAIRQTVPERGGHWLISLLNGPDGSLILQLGLATMDGIRAGRQFDRLDTYVVSARTGEGVLVSHSLPRLLAFAGGNFIGARDEPVPQLMIYRMVGSYPDTNK